MFRFVGMALAGLILFAGTALADPIEGDWKTDKGSTAGISSCGGGFCIKLKSGTHAGKDIGTFKADGTNSYSGKITDPETTRPIRARQPCLERD